MEPPEFQPPYAQDKMEGIQWYHRHSVPTSFLPCTSCVGEYSSRVRPYATRDCMGGKCPPFKAKLPVPPDGRGFCIVYTPRGTVSYSGTAIPPSPLIQCQQNFISGSPLGPLYQIPGHFSRQPIKSRILRLWFIERIERDCLGPHW